MTCRTADSLPVAAARPTEWSWRGCRTDSGANNMDLDRALFDSVRRGEEKPFVRFYRWSSPALSYGRTQGISESARNEALAKGLSVVRRPTGGGKVSHDQDLCFSIAWAKSKPALPWTITDSYQAIHLWIQQSLSDCGFKTDLIGKPADPGNGWCFQSAVCSDLLLNGRKVVGGAQWREGNAALHQGSIQLAVTDSQLEIFKARFASLFSARFEPPAGNS